MPLLEDVLHAKTYAHTLNILDTYTLPDIHSICAGMEVESLDQVAHKRISDVAVDCLLEDWNTHDSYPDHDGIDSQIEWSIYLTLEMYSA